MATCSESGAHVAPMTKLRQAPPSTPAWGAFGFQMSLLSSAKRVPVRSSLQLSSRMSQNLLPVDSELHNLNKFSCGACACAGVQVAHGGALGFPILVLSQAVGGPGGPK